jgi:hypothetical protein
MKRQEKKMHRLEKLKKLNTVFKLKFINLFNFHENLPAPLADDYIRRLTGLYIDLKTLDAEYTFENIFKKELELESDIEYTITLLNRFIYFIDMLKDINIDKDFDLEFLFDIKLELDSLLSNINSKLLLPFSENENHSFDSSGYIDFNQFDDLDFEFPDDFDNVVNDDFRLPDFLTSSTEKIEKSSVTNSEELLLFIKNNENNSSFDLDINAANEHEKQKIVTILSDFRNNKNNKISTYIIDNYIKDLDPHEYEKLQILDLEEGLDVWFGIYMSWLKNEDFRKVIEEFTGESLSVGFEEVFTKFMEKVQDISLEYFIFHKR